MRRGNFGLFHSLSLVARTAARSRRCWRHSERMRIAVLESPKCGGTFQIGSRRDYKVGPAVRGTKFYGARARPQLRNQRLRTCSVGDTNAARPRGQRNTIAQGDLTLCIVH